MGWEESRHPRVPSGASTGGQFTSAGGFYFPKSTPDERYVRSIPTLNEEQVRDLTKKMYGQEMSRDDAASVAGAIPGAEVYITTDDNSISVHFEQEREFPDGNKRAAVIGYRWLHPDRVIENSSLEVSKSFRGQGIGFQVFENQVNAAAKLGFKEIVTSAVGDSTPDNPRGAYANGSWTWARMGYDGEIPDPSIRRGGKPPNGAKTMHDLMSTQEGTDWWRANAESFSGTFDLREGSTSRRVLAEYGRLKREKR